MGKVVKLSIILLVITAVSAGALSVTNNITKEIIDEKALAANKVYMEEILPDADDFAVVDDAGIGNVAEVEEAYEALKGGDVYGYVIKTKTSGYGGDIIMLTGIKTDGTVAGMKVASQSETAGLGSKITEEDFTSQFEGKSADGELSLDGDIDQVGGATVSSKAALNGVNAAIEVYNSVLK